MAHLGKVQLVITFVAPPEKVKEVDKLVASHAAWMRETHPRDGANALLGYNFAKGPELSNALDPSSAPTGSTRYVLTEIYESDAGIQEHWAKSQKSWSDFAAMVQLISGCNPLTLHSGQIVQSLW